MAYKTNSRGFVKRSNGKKGKFWAVFVGVLLLLGFLVWFFLKRKKKAGASGPASPASPALPVVGMTENEKIHGLNNPGNILYNAVNKWQGQTGFNRRYINGKQYDYVNFDTLANGMRAIGKLVDVHFVRNGFDKALLDASPAYLQGVGNVYASYAGNPAVAKGFEEVVKQKADDAKYDTLRDLLVDCIIFYEANKNY